MKRASLIPLLLAVTACSAAADVATTVATTAAPVTTDATVTTAASAPVSTTAAAGGGSVAIGASDFAFSPSTVTITVGDSVTWNLTDGTHTTTSGTPPTGDGLWSETLDPNVGFTFTFEEAGEYPFFCRFHQDFMSGTVIVEP